MMYLYGSLSTNRDTMTMIEVDRDILPGSPFLSNSNLLGLCTPPCRIHQQQYSGRPSTGSTQPGTRFEIKKLVVGGNGCWLVKYLER